MASKYKPNGKPCFFTSAISDFYLTNAVARASAVMAGMSALKSSHNQKLKAAE